MRAMLVAPAKTQLPLLPDGVTVRLVRDDGLTEFDYPSSSGVILLLARPEFVTDINELLQCAYEETSTEKACAFVPSSEESKHVLSTAAAAYAFDAKAVHLAGGLDSRLTPDAMGMDMLFRLAARAVETQTVPSTLIRESPSFLFSSYLTVFSRNLTSTTQLRFLAPLFLGLIDQPLRDSGVDTAALDLQRSPGNDDIPKLSVPAQAFSGAQLVRTWLDDLPMLEDGKVIIAKSRRLPDTVLVGLDDFVEEMWVASSIPHDKQVFLRQAFADISRPREVNTLFVIPSDDHNAVERLETLYRAYGQPAFLYDTSTGKVSYRENPDGEWAEASSRLKEAQQCAAAYLIASHTREVPWLQSSSGVIILDVTTSSLLDDLCHDHSGYGRGDALLGAQATMMNETFGHVDHVIVRDSQQRDFVLGALIAIQRLNQHTYDEDFSLSNLVACENGTRAAIKALSRPCRPFERVNNSEEYERTIFDSAARADRSMTDIIHNIGERVGNTAKGFETRLKGVRR